MPKPSRSEHTYPQPATGCIDVAQCALKLWQLQGLFKRLAGTWGLTLEVSGVWPGLALSGASLFTRKRLALRLQPEFPADAREFYEFRFTERSHVIWGGRLCHDFGCGRLDPDELLCEARVQRELAAKAMLLGLANIPIPKVHAEGSPGRAFSLRNVSTDRD